jgi:hypothetical protein
MTVSRKRSSPRQALNSSAENASGSGSSSSQRSVSSEEVIVKVFDSVN